MPTDKAAPIYVSEKATYFLNKLIRMKKIMSCLYQFAVPPITFDIPKLIKESPSHLNINLTAASMCKAMGAS